MMFKKLNGNDLLSWLPKAKALQDEIIKRSRLSDGLEIPHHFVMVLPDEKRMGLIQQAKEFGAKGKYFFVIRGGEQSDEGDGFVQIPDSFFDGNLDAWLVCHAKFVVGNEHPLMMDAAAVYRDGCELRVIGNHALVDYGIAPRCQNLMCALSKKFEGVGWSARKLFVADYLKGKLGEL